ncbi:potassium voltage-gated channel subfamily E member 2-like [Rana temporaria]|uniref:potassium voltage-gated channel subfamily E member 2-like n=1 Tax=Rana temporaria TaxID=8407 RepID=UPI001AAD9964|nr:potassium voltage-gated channel subfamily E member 2-like [Rana temporaria]
MSELGNLTLSMGTFVKFLLITAFDASKNTTQPEEKTQQTINHDDLVGAVTFIMVFIGIFSFFIVAVLVIAIRSRSYDQLGEQYLNNCNLVESDSTIEYFQGAKNLCHENKTVE